MPIRPENRSRYPKNWQQIRAQVQARSGDKCEGCGVSNGVYRITHGDGLEEVTDNVLIVNDAATVYGAHVARIVLTVAHRDHQPENNDPANLAHWCQRCHNRYDAPTRARNRKARRVQALLEGKA